MNRIYSKSRNNCLQKAIYFLVMTFFLIQCSIPPRIFAQNQIISPVVQNMISPPLLKGIKFYPDQPFRLDFFVDSGKKGMNPQELKNISEKFVKYFLASLTVPEDELWVNLSPYEKERIIPAHLGQTEMGRDMLAQDFVLKQISSSLMNPEQEWGREFWQAVYQKASEKFGNNDLPMEALNKIWIIPQKAVLYVKDDVVMITDSHLKVEVMSDQKDITESRAPARDNEAEITEIIKSTLIPQIEKEVNEGEQFIQLRQIFHSLILATWFKRHLKNTLLGSEYADRNKVSGIDIVSDGDKYRIYENYLKQFKKGAFEYLKEDYDPVTQNIIPKKYFSGGVFGKFDDKAMFTTDNPDDIKISGDLSRVAVVLNDRDMAVLVDVSHATSKGKHDTQEDRFIDAMINIPGILHGKGRFMVIMDGHLGSRAVDKVHMHIKDFFEESLEDVDGEDIEAALEKTVKRLHDLTKDDRSGTTLSIVYVPVDEEVAYVSILGDSPVIILDNNLNLNISPVHHVANAKEAARVEAQGKSLKGRTITRTLGDRDVDDFLSREPEVYTVDLTEESFIVLGSDGFLDLTSTYAASDIQEIYGFIVNQNATARDLLSNTEKFSGGDNQTVVLYKKFRQKRLSVEKVDDRQKRVMAGISELWQQYFRKDNANVKEILSLLEKDFQFADYIYSGSNRGNKSVEFQVNEIISHLKAELALDRVIPRNKNAFQKIKDIIAFQLASDQFADDFVVVMMTDLNDVYTVLLNKTRNSQLNKTDIKDDKDPFSRLVHKFLSVERPGQELMTMLGANRYYANFGTRNPIKINASVLFDMDDGQIWITKIPYQQVTSESRFRSKKAADELAGRLHYEPGDLMGSESIYAGGKATSFPGKLFLKSRADSSWSELERIVTENGWNMNNDIFRFIHRNGYRSILRITRPFAPHSGEKDMRFIKKLGYMRISPRLLAYGRTNGQSNEHHFFMEMEEILGMNMADTTKDAKLNEEETNLLLDLIKKMILNGIFAGVDFTPSNIVIGNTVDDKTRRAYLVDIDNVHKINFNKIEDMVELAEIYQSFYGKQFAEYVQNNEIIQNFFEDIKNNPANYWNNDRSVISNDVMGIDASVGGINFNPSSLSIDTLDGGVEQRGKKMQEGKAWNLPSDPVHVNIDGLVPLILRIETINLPALLGQKNQESAEFSS